MKTRTGFVSNSSSSSFIIGVGVVKDQFAFDMMYPKWSANGSLPDDMQAVTIAQIKAGEGLDAKVIFEYDSATGAISKVKSIEIESFDYSCVYKDLSSCNDDDIILIYNGGYSLDEDNFWNEDSGEYDYDIDPEEFSSDEQAAMELLSSHVVDGDFEYGAGRNG